MNRCATRVFASVSRSGLLCFFGGLGLVVLVASGCQKSAPSAGGPTAPTITIDQVPGHESLAQDTSPKVEPRLVPAETYVRTYLTYFGYLSPVELQTTEFPGGYNQLFDTWAQYLTALGLPNYAADLPRLEQTNLLMVAAFERVGIALCDKAVERDLKSGAPVDQRKIFAFEVPAADPKNAKADILTDQAAFATRFDVLHMTFLGYPASLALTDRTNRFFGVYSQVAAYHDPTKSKLTAGQAGWAAICYGLIRHPEFHLY